MDREEIERGNDLAAFVMFKSITVKYSDDDMRCDVIFNGRQTLIGDPAMTFVVAMTAAAITGHIIERTREQMHATLDHVLDVGLAKLLEATETRQ